MAVASAIAFPTALQAEIFLPPKNKNYYCAKGTYELTLHGDEGTVENIYRYCEPGDTIGFPASGQGSVGAQICDFSKATA